MIAAVAAPLLVARLAPRAPDAAGAPIRIPYFEEATGWQDRAPAPGARVRRVVALLAWCALVLAAGRPQWVGDPVSLPVHGRDLMLALDLSGSMREQDMRSGTGFERRIDVVKRVAGDFVERRAGDRVGLILFGTRPYLRAPFTLDLDTVSEMVSETVLGLAGEQTAIGDAIGLAVKRLRERPMEERVARAADRRHRHREPGETAVRGPLRRGGGDHDPHGGRRGRTRKWRRAGWAPCAAAPVPRSTSPP